LVELKKTV